MNPFLGEIRLFSFNFAPQGWAQCAGQLLPIIQNQALFALLGTQFGGNGSNNFGLPDMRGRVPIHTGPNNPIGGLGGSETVTLSLTQLPQHQHLLQAVNSQGTAETAIGNLLAQSNAPSTPPARYAAGNINVTPLNPASVQPVGSGQPHNNLQPYLVMNYCIALQGIFPSRS